MLNIYILFCQIAECPETKDIDRFHKLYIHTIVYHLRNSSNTPVCHLVFIYTNIKGNIIYIYIYVYVCVCDICLSVRFFLSLSLSGKVK